MPINIRKILITEFGDYSKVQVVDDTLSDPPTNRVQIKVIYSGFSGSDINMRIGVYPFQKKAPLTPGYCLVGTVHANGVGSKKFNIGDTVCCLSMYDAEATFANMPEKYLVPVPSGVDLQQACALILDWNTAYAMVMHTANIENGQKVFVHGMSGAVGYALLKLCQLQGAKVYGTASERNHSAIRELGGIPFTYLNKDWIGEMRAVGGADVVFDALGFESFDESYSILNGKKKSVLIGYGGNLRTLNNERPRLMIWPTVKNLLSQNLKVWSNKQFKFYAISKDDKNFVPDLQALFNMVQQGKIVVPIKRIFSLDEVPIAHRDWTKLTGMGSVLVQI